MSSKEEFALHTGHRSNVAAVKDAQIKFRKEECAFKHGAKFKRCSSEGCAIKLGVEECV